MNSVLSAKVMPLDATHPASQNRRAGAAREFESTLIASLLESLEKTYASLPGQSIVPGSDDYNYLGAQALASGIVERGGFGISAFIAQHLSGHERNR